MSIYMTTLSQTEISSPRWGRAISTFLATFAFPVAWYACVAASSWPQYMSEMQRARENGNQLDAYQRWGVALSEALFFAAAFWLVHVIVSYSMPRLRRATRDTTLVASCLSGIATFLAWKAIVVLADRTSASFWLLISGVVGVAVVVTAFTPSVLHLTAQGNGDER